ncbi:MAG: hypothetical protein IPI49_16065 [Myxococcales bacterium]|nr:hypothetical protein [Myxococcales bacterium]
MARAAPGGHRHPRVSVTRQDALVQGERSRRIEQALLAGARGQKQRVGQGRQRRGLGAGFSRGLDLCDQRRDLGVRRGGQPVD